MKKKVVQDADVDTIGYRRVSKGEQAQAWKTSLKQQTDAIIALALKLARVLLPEYIWEDRFSGEDAEDRQGFMAMVEFCRRHPRPRSRPGFVLVLNDSRFGRFRNPDEAAHWRFVMAECGWMVRFVENDDTEHPTTRHVMRAVGGAQASEYLAALRENAKRGTRGAAEQGLWQNEAPFGYRRIATAPGREPVVLEPGQRKSDDQVVRLTPGPPEEVELVQWMFQTYADGLLPLRQLAAEVRRRSSRLKFAHQSVAKMLANRTYLGHVIWCRRPHDKEERKEIKVRPEGEWVVRENVHEPLVTQEVFDRVQQRLAENRARTRGAASAYVLSGIIRCTHCGRTYIGGGGGGKAPPDDPGRYRIYKCAGSDDTAGRVCPGKIGTLMRRSVEALVIDLVAEVVSDPAIQVMIREEIDRYLQELRGGSAQEKAALAARKQKLEQEKNNLVDAIAAGVLTTGEAKARMDRVRGDLQDAEQKLARLGALPKVERQLEREADRLAKLAADFPARAKELSGPALRELLKPWIEDATFDKETRELTVTVRRVPAAASGDGSDWQPDAGRVHFRMRLPVPQRHRQTGRMRPVDYATIAIERKAS